MNTQTKDKEVLNITKGKWELMQSRGNNIYEYKVVIPNHRTICEKEADKATDIEQTKTDLQAICTAVNSTYGKNLNPAAMEGLYKALEAIYLQDQVKGILPAKERVEMKKALFNAKNIKP